jgi:hypothetical protein
MRVNPSQRCFNNEKCELFKAIGNGKKKIDAIIVIQRGNNCGAGITKLMGLLLHSATVTFAISVTE